ncbi:unnamed protein product [Peronospora farinosa]|uniref:protein O-GlcNAc transferase n=1 Tax=Peronospora farinosa TaxID=134698 RepID=A0AAV0UBH4_9STRA|nr:unnamed protein product [Peronospora farinosa]CAI5733992.1 unnamed protein product [Peronospora farinosa]
MILVQTELLVEVQVDKNLVNTEHSTRVCILIQIVYMPMDVALENEETEPYESCFEQSLGHAKFHVAGLVPGTSYSVTGKLENNGNIMALSSRIFSVGSVLLPGVDNRVSIADALKAGTKLHDAWDRANALKIYRYVLDVFPDYGPAQHLLGVALYQDGKQEEALPYLYRAVQSNQSEENFHNSLGMCLKSLGRVKEAIEHYRRALEINPMLLKASVNLGDAMQAIGRWEDAMDEYSKVAKVPMSVLDTQLDIEKAENVVKDATGKRCELIHFTDGWYQADRCLNEALKRWADEPAFHNDRGNLFANAGQFEMALDEYQRSSDFGLLAGTLNLAETLEALGRTQRSIDLYNQILDNEIVDRFYPRTRIMVMKATVLPRVLPATQIEIDLYRDRFDREVKTLLQNLNSLGETEVDPTRISLSTAITLTAHNRNNRELKAAMGLLYWQLLYQRQIMREDFVASYGLVPLPFTQQSESIKKPEIGPRRLRVGFVSRYMFNSAVGLYMAKQVKKGGKEVEAINETIVGLPKDVRIAREAIRAWDVDVLIYPELGMDKTTYFVSLARLAPVQAVWWGNADTSGVPTMDYYLTSEFEHSSVNSHYSEVVYCFKGTGIYHRLPILPKNTSNRDKIRHGIEERFDIPADFHFYLAIESIIHIHPDFDVAVAEILDKDKKAHFFLLSTSSRKAWKTQLQARMESAGVIADRLHFLVDVDQKQEPKLMQAADAVLSSLHLTRPRASLQAFAAGAPVVTFPNELWASRITYGFYQQMGINDLIATSLDEYVALAIKLATNAAFHEKMVQLIQQNRSKLSEDKQAVKEWEQFFDFAGRQIFSSGGRPTYISSSSYEWCPLQRLKGVVDGNQVEDWSQVVNAEGKLWSANI